MPEAGRLVVGTAAFGLPYGLGRNGEAPTLMSEAEVAAIVDEALTLSIATFDTAPAYGSAEERLGRTVGARGQVWTKLGRHETRGVGLAAELTASVDRSLARLARPAIDVLQWHNWTAELSSDPGFVEAWRRLESDGRVTRLGATTYGEVDAEAAVKSGLFSLVQVEWNVLNQSVVERVAAEASARGVELAVRSVLLQGALSDESRTLPADTRLHDGIGRVRAVADAVGCRTQELALGAALAHPSISWVLVGVDRPSQLAEARATLRVVDGIRAHWDAVRALDMKGDPATDPRTWRFDRR